MPRNRLLLLLESLLGRKRERPRFLTFIDPFGNFELSYPSGWSFDRDIALVNGRYTVAFSSHDGSFIISLDTALPPGFDFPEYAKEELESPSSGIYTKMKGSTFRDMPAFRREYSYESGGKRFFGGGVMFNTGRSVFSISWAGPEKERNELMPLLNRMLNSLVIRRGMMIRRCA